VDVTALDASIEQDIDMSTSGITNAAGASDGDNTIGNPVQDAVPTSVDAIAAAVAPSKKETSLREFLGKMDDYAPIVGLAFFSHFPLALLSTAFAVMDVSQDVHP
jgi:transcription initiation factor TFIID subunit 10